MSLHGDLLEQAFHLIKREPRKPRQASLRRAVSAAYYALFHLLIAEGARRLAPARPKGLRPLIQRAYNHGDMRAVCVSIASGQRSFLKSGSPGQNASPTHQALSFPLDAALFDVIEVFLLLQAARNDADYNLNTQLSRTDARRHARAAREAFADWASIRDTPNATVFLSALLLQRHWGR